MTKKQTTPQPAEDHPLETAEPIVLDKPLPVDISPSIVYIASLPAKTSIRTTKAALNLVAGLLGAIDAVHVNWGALSYRQLAAIQTRLTNTVSTRTGKPLSATYINKIMYNVRRVLNQAWRLGQMPTDVYQRVIDFELVDNSTVPAGRDLTGVEINALFDACSRDETIAGVRDAAILACLYPGGMRRAEITSLTMADLRRDQEYIGFIVHGKKKKQRLIWFDNGAADALNDWLALRGDEPGPVFVAINVSNTGEWGEKPMTPQAVYKMVNKRAAEAGVSDFSPHDLRRTLIGDLLDTGMDIATVADIVGHANVQTTRRYDRRTKRAQQQAISQLRIPYQTRTTKQAESRGQKHPPAEAPAPLNPEQTTSFDGEESENNSPTA